MDNPVKTEKTPILPNEYSFEVWSSKRSEYNQNTWGALEYDSSDIVTAFDGKTGLAIAKQKTKNAFVLSNGSTRYFIRGFKVFDKGVTSEPDCLDIETEKAEDSITVVES